MSLILYLVHMLSVGHMRKISQPMKKPSTAPQGARILSTSWICDSMRSDFHISSFKFDFTYIYK